MISFSDKSGIGLVESNGDWKSYQITSHLTGESLGCDPIQRYLRGVFNQPKDLATDFASIAG
jgi:hypothetical protein